MASFPYCDRWQPVEGGPWILPVCWDMFQPSMTQDKSRYVCEFMVNLNTIHSKLSINVSGAVQGQNLNLNTRNLLIPHMAWSDNLMGHYMLHHKTFGFKPSVYSPHIDNNIKTAGWTPVLHNFMKSSSVDNNWLYFSINLVRVCLFIHLSITWTDCAAVHSTYLLSLSWLHSPAAYHLQSCSGRLLQLHTPQVFLYSVYSWETFMFKLPCLLSCLLTFLCFLDLIFAWTLSVLLAWFRLVDDLWSGSKTLLLDFVLLLWVWVHLI